MQNQLLKYIITDNTVDNNYAINPTKQQLFYVPKEESQMITGKTFSFTGTRPVGYNNDPLNETVNRDSTVANGITANTSFTDTDYVGLSVYDVPTFLVEGYYDFTIIDLIRTRNMIVNTTNNYLTNVANGIQLIRVPSGLLNVVLTDATAIAANNGSTLKKYYGDYYFTITPKFFTTSVIAVDSRGQYDTNNLNDDVNSTDPDNIVPTYKRRTVYECNKTDGLGLLWNFEQNGLQSGRLIGSVVEVWDSSQTVLKQVKVINESEFNFTDVSKNFNIVMSPDTVGYDSPVQAVGVGDVLKIYPRETSFNQLTILLSYQNQSTQTSSALSFLMNDVARDMTTGVYEIYDSNGITIDSSGNFNGNVIQQYQITQVNGYEIRKRING